MVVEAMGVDEITPELEETKKDRGPEKHQEQTDTISRKPLPSFYVTIICCHACFPN